MYKRENQINENDYQEKNQASKSISRFLTSKGRKRIGLSFGKIKHKKRYVAEERDYEKIFMNRATIFLPSGLQPYPTQKLMMVKMLNALNNKSNALIESPTGSGKTLALLSSSCSWITKYKEERAERRNQCPRHGLVKTDFSSMKLPKAAKIEKMEAVNETSIKVEKTDNVVLDTNDSTLITLDDSSEEVLLLDDTLKNKSAFDELNEEFQDDFQPLSNILNGKFERRDMINLNEKNYSKSNFNWMENDDENSCCANVSINRLECTCLPRVIIYYGTRTHKQIAQVIKEYARLPFGVDGSLRHTILGSRDHGCVNPITRSKPDITTHCKELLGHEGIGCTYRNDLRKFDNNPHRLRTVVEENGGDRVWDMEDLVKTLSETRPAVCPYFAVTRTFTIDADLVFCPFNYLIDPIIRRSSDVHLKNSIVILDEAHNVEDICRDAASFELKEREMFFCLENLTEKENMTLKKIHELTGTSAKKVTKQEMFHAANQFDDYVQNELSAEELAEALAEFHQSLEILLSFGRSLYNWLKTMAKDTLVKCPQKPDGSHTLTYTWSQLLESLTNERNSSINLLLPNEAFKELKAAWLNVAGKEKSVLDDDNKKTRANVDVAKDQALNFFRPAQAAYVAFEKFITFLQFFSVKENQEFYKCNVLIERINFNSNTQFQSSQFSNQKKSRTLGMRSQLRQTQYSDDNWINSRNTALKYEPIKANCDVTLSLWCMFPSVSFMDAFKECQSVILASGTLCPTETLKSELGLPFKAEMEGTQVISKERIFATVLSAGPSGVRLNATYKNIASGSDFMIELARVIVSTCLIVPKGVLCFVSSYNVLNLLKECIDQQGLNIPLQSRKVIFEEPRRSADLQSTLDAYEEAIKNPKHYGPNCDGALMLAVFRGKVSEGIDFADDKARCVICVGIPYPNARNELVLQKKRFNDENAKSAKILTGDEWYTTQAYRALNQALGRCLRHRDDWGALLLVDERFEAKANPRCSDSKKISRWVRDRLIIYSDFVKFKSALCDFVNQMTKGNISENNDEKTKIKMEKKPLIDIF